jgi:hypothetical protein
MNRRQFCVALMAILVVAATAYPQATVRTSHGPGANAGPVSLTPQFLAGWNQLQTGMESRQVAQLLGNDWNFSIRVPSNTTFQRPATTTVWWWRSSSSQQTDQHPWYYVEFRYNADSKRWGAVRRQVYWPSTEAAARRAEAIRQRLRALGAGQMSPAQRDELERLRLMEELAETEGERLRTLAMERWKAQR